MKGHPEGKSEKKRIISKLAAQSLKYLMFNSVEEGTGKRAAVKGWQVAGKTGTAEKILEGGYSRKKINTFASVFPASNPKYSLVVMLDEPKTNSEYVYNYRDGSGIKYKGTPFNTAGWTSVEVVGQIIEKIGPILATKYAQIN